MKFFHIFNTSARLWSVVVLHLFQRTIKPPAPEPRGLLSSVTLEDNCLRDNPQDGVNESEKVLLDERTSDLSGGCLLHPTPKLWRVCFDGNPSSIIGGRVWVSVI